MDGILAQHPPAVKVGGRRLSTSRPKHHPHHEPLQTDIAAEADEEPSDYPRPNPPADLMNLTIATSGEAVEQQPIHIDHRHAHYDEEMPKNEKKQHQLHEVEKKWKAVKLDVNRPTRDNIPAAGGGGRRIDQPAGRGLV